MRADLASSPHKVIVSIVELVGASITDLPVLLAKNTKRDVAVCEDQMEREVMMSNK